LDGTTLADVVQRTETARTLFYESNET
jgi:hypothetical protein